VKDAGISKLNIATLVLEKVTEVEGEVAGVFGEVVERRYIAEGAIDSAGM